MTVTKSWRSIDERDRAAEVWLRTHHGPEWYVGDASNAEWAAAYAAVDERTETPKGEASR